MSWAGVAHDPREDIKAAIAKIRAEPGYPVHHHVVSPQAAKKGGPALCLECGGVIDLSPG